MNAFLDLFVSDTGKALIASFKRAPQDWRTDEYHLINTEAKTCFWIANGASFFRFESPGYLGWIEKYVVFYYAKKMTNRKLEDKLTGVDQYQI